MCVALPAKVLWVGQPTGMSLPGRVAYADRAPVTVELTMVPDVAVGDYVIVHSGYAISRVEPARADEAWELFA